MGHSAMEHEAVGFLLRGVLALLDNPKCPETYLVTKNFGGSKTISIE